MNAPTTVTTSATTLFHVAASALGDAMLWTRIAAANDLTDPWVDGIVTLAVPRPDGRPSFGGVPRE